MSNTLTDFQKQIDKLKDLSAFPCVYIPAGEDFDLRISFLLTFPIGEVIEFSTIYKECGGTTSSVALDMDEVYKLMKDRTFTNQSEFLRILYEEVLFLLPQPISCILNINFFTS